MAGGNIRAGGAFVEIFGKDQLDKSLKAAGANFKAFGAVVTGIGAGIAAAGTAALTPLLAMTKTFASVGDDAQKAALRTGATTNAITELGYAAQQSGSSMEDVERGIKNMQRTLDEASKGGTAATEALREMGLAGGELIGQSPDKQFELIADRISKIEDPSKRAALAMKVFGRSGIELLPLMLEGARGIEALRKEAERLGVSINQNDADAAAALGDAWDRVKTSFKGAAVQIGGALAPALQILTDSLTRVVVTTIEWLRMNRETVLTVAGLAVGAIAAGTALVGLGIAITAVGTALSGAIALVGSVTAIFMALINPINLVIGALGAAGIAMGVFAARGTGALEVVKDAMGGVADALRAGNLEDAWEIALTGVEVIFARFAERVGNMWDAFIKSIFDSRLFKLAEFVDLSPVGVIGGIREELSPDAAAEKRRALATADAETRLEIARLEALGNRVVAEIEAEADRFDRQRIEEERLRSEFAAEDLLPAASDDQLSQFASATGLIGTAIARAVEFGLETAKGISSRQLQSTGTTLFGGAELLGADSIDKQQLDEAKKLVEEMRGVKRAIEENGAVFV